MRQIDVAMRGLTARAEKGSRMPGAMSSRLDTGRPWRIGSGVGGPCAEHAARGGCRLPRVLGLRVGVAPLVCLVCALCRNLCPLWLRDTR